MLSNGYNGLQKHQKSSFSVTLSLGIHNPLKKWPKYALNRKKYVSSKSFITSAIVNIMMWCKPHHAKIGCNASARNLGEKLHVLLPFSSQISPSAYFFIVFDFSFFLNTLGLLLVNILHKSSKFPHKNHVMTSIITTPNLNRCLSSSNLSAPWIFHWT